MTRETPLRLLVTGVGGDLGQAIVKALRLSSLVIESLQGTDMDHNGIGGAFVDLFHVLPRADHPEYISALEALCRTQNITAVIPGSEVEVFILGKCGGAAVLPSGIPLICQPYSWVKTYADKLTCMQRLSGKVDLAPFADGSDREAVTTLVSKVGFPFIVKPRLSRGSRQICRVESEQQLQAALSEVECPLVQQFIKGDDGEFSIGVFCCAAFTTAIAYRRDLGPSGCSWYAETVQDPLVLEYAVAVAKASQLSGSANVQVRKSGGKIQLLEINARFSSLVAARAASGFHDVEWSLRDRLHWNLVKPAEPYKHLRFRRFFHELLDTGSGFKAEPAWSPK